MYLDDGAVHRDRLKPDAHYLFALQVFKYPVEHAVLSPTVHTGVDCVPPAETRWQTPPLAAMLSNIQNGIEHLQIWDAHIAPLYR